MICVPQVPKEKFIFTNAKELIQYFTFSLSTNIPCQTDITKHFKVTINLGLDIINQITKAM